MRQGQRFNLIVLALIGLILFGCSSLDDSINAQATPTPTPTASPTATALPTPTATQEPTAALPICSPCPVRRYSDTMRRPFAILTTPMMSTPIWRWCSTA